MDLGTTIKNIRKQRGQTQYEFAALCNISPTYLSQIENNQREPNLSTLKSIGSNLEMPLPILFFLSINEEDIAPNKREAYNMIGSSVKSLIHEFFSV